MGHIFVSYSRHDQPYAQQLADDLRQHGFDVWMDNRIDYGDRWWQTIVAAIRASDAFIVVMSPDSEKSEWVEREVLLAQRSLKPIFPLLLEGDEFPLLITVQFADVRDGKMPRDDFYARLAIVIAPKDSTGQFVTPPEPEPTAPIPAQPVPNRKAWWAGGLVAVVALAIFGVVLLSGILDGDDNKQADDRDATQTGESTEALTDTPTEQPTPNEIAQVGTATSMPTWTATASDTPTRRVSSTPTYAPTETDRPTSTFTASHSPTATNTQTPTPTLTLTATATDSDPDDDGFVGGNDACPNESGTINGCPATATPTPTETDTLTATYTASLTATDTNTPSPTHTVTYTLTTVPTDTPSATPSLTSTPTATETSTPRCTGSGEIAFVSDREGNFEIYIMNIDGTNLCNLTQNGSLDIDPAWSPDGSKIAFASSRDGNYDIYVVNADGSDLRKLTDDPEGDTSPAWSPDGLKITFASYRSCNGQSCIYVMNSDGSEQSEFRNLPVFGTSPTWSSDGSALFVVNRPCVGCEGNISISYIPLNSNGHAIQDGQSPTSSPFENQIVFSSSRSGNDEIYAYDLDGSEPRNLSQHSASDRMPDFSLDGSHIAFVSNRDGDDEIYIMKADGSDQYNITNSPDSGESSPAWRPAPQ